MLAIDLLQAEVQYWRRKRRKKSAPHQDEKRKDYTYQQLRKGPLPVETA
jgi:hypothetical protein